jgi:aspartyl-tRNA synthetase
VTEHFAGSGFKVFAGMIERDPKTRIWAIPAKTGGSRAFCDRMNGWAQSQGQPGLGYVFWREEQKEWPQQIELKPDGVTPQPSVSDAKTGHSIVREAAGPIAKNIGDERTEAIRSQLGLEAGDACFFVGGDPAKFYKFAGEARTRAGEELNLIDRDQFALCWIVNFPFYEWNEDEKMIEFAHNPFSMPQGGMEALVKGQAEGNDALLGLKAFQYDMVCNGFEIASGGIRNHMPETMVKAFEIAGLSRETVEERFGGLYRAFQYGAPPHGGMAAGVDRVVMLITGAKNLREISLFPMNQQAQDLLMGSPAEASNKQLTELHIRPIAAVKK